MDARRRSVEKYDTKKLFITNASDNHTSGNYVSGVYTPICSHTRRPDVLQHSVSVYILRESVMSVIIWRIEKI